MFVSIAEVWRGETKESMIDHFRLDPYLHHLGDRFWRHETPVNHKSTVHIRSRYYYLAGRDMKSYSCSDIIDSIKVLKPRPTVQFLSQS